MHMSDDAKPESEMYIGDVVRDGPETQALISIKRIKAEELTEEHIGKFIGCNDPNTGANYGARIENVIRDDAHRNPGMLVMIQHPAKPGLAFAGRVDRMRLRLDQEIELFEMMAW
jgi:hypothetical protein